MELTQQDVHDILNARLDRFQTKVLERIDERMAHYEALNEAKDRGSWLGRNVYLPLAAFLAGIVIPMTAFYATKYVDFQTKEDVRQTIATHTGTNHPGAVSRDEWGLLLAQIGELKEYVKGLDKRLQTQWQEFNKAIAKAEKGR